MAPCGQEDHPEHLLDGVEFMDLCEVPVHLGGPIKGAPLNLVKGRFVGCVTPVGNLLPEKGRG